MPQKKDFKKINNWLWEVPKTYRTNMLVPARVYATSSLLEDILGDRSMNQLVNTASIPGVVKYVLAMPDAHEGYGPPIGGVIATRLPYGLISPGALGFDENCGIRLLASGYQEQEIKEKIENLAQEMHRQVPSGLGQGRKTKLSFEEINSILNKGASYLVGRGYGVEQDLKNCESGGMMAEANSSCVSDKAKTRGRNQVGTLGSGNHFLEIQKVEKIFDKEIAAVFGLRKGQAIVMIHTGSRGLGHQNCSDYLRVMDKAMGKYNIKLPDRELAGAPFSSQEGQRFFKAAACGANFAWANRQMISFYVRQAWEKVLGKQVRLDLVYDVAHNIAKLETHEVDGEKIKLCVHRKGATRAFPPGHPDLSQEYQETGQPVLIPGSMGTASYVLAGVESTAQSFYSTCHGSGRRMSRRQASRNISGQEVVERLKNRGILVKSNSMRGVSEEAPDAYKNIDEVVEVVSQAGLAKKVARLLPLAVIKGK